MSFTSGAFAQTPPPTTAPATSAEATGLSEIVVTARRRAERLQEVPISASAFDANSLAQRNISNTQDLLGQVPSVVVGGSGQQRSTENITIRGQGSTFNASPGVVLYSAEVPLIADQRNNAQNGGGLNYYDLSSLQVLRGPQGTLFGRNTTGGALLFEPQRPTDRFEGYGQIQYGNYDSIELRGAVNVPIVEDTLLLRVAGIYQKRDGFTYERTTGTDLDNRNRYSFRAGLTWRPAPGIENYLLATVGRVQEHGTGVVLNAVPAGVNPQNGVPYSDYLQEQIDRGIRSTELSPLLYSERTRYFSITDVFSAELTDGLTFRNIANFQRLKNSAPFDSDGIPDDQRPPLSTNGGGGIGSQEIDPGGLPDYNYYTDVRQYSFEPQLQGKIGGDALNFTVGAYYESVKPLGLQLVSASNQTRRGQRSTSQALYAQGTLSFGSFSDSLNGLRLTAGYRYTWDDLTAFSNYGLPGAPVTTERVKYKAPNWTVGLDYDVMRNVLVFAKISRGYKSGGIGTATPTPELRSFRPEFVTSYEGGIKADWHIGGMPIRTNLGYYYTDYKDLQRTGGVAYEFNGGTIFGAQTSNAGQAHIQGFEFEGEIRPTSWFTLSGSYSHTAAKYDEYTSQSLFPGGIPAFGLPPGFDCGDVPYNGATGECVLNGLPFQFTPKNQFSITGRVDLPLDESIGKVSISATYAYIDAQYTSPSKAPVDEPFAYIGGNCPRLQSGPYAGSVQCGPGNGYGLLGVNIQWQSVAGSNFDLSAFATNLTNEDYIISSNGSSYQSGFNSYVYGEPRMYGISLRYNFGK